MNYKKFIESRFEIVNKDLKAVPFILNTIQDRYLTQDSSGKDVILKARKQGFSSVILARYTADFILRENSRSVVIADSKENAIALLDRVKYYLKSYEAITGKQVPLKYNSKNELVNAAMNTRYFVGSAENVEFGRSQDITNLHFSEAAFYPDFDKLKASALQATVDNAHVVVETTANGFNIFKSFWDESKKNESGFKAIFYKGSDFYSPEFLAMKKQELKDKFPQEYPEEDIEAFLLSGTPYFGPKSVQWYFDKKYKPMTQDQIYV